MFLEKPSQQELVYSDIPVWYSNDILNWFNQSHFKAFDIIWYYRTPSINRLFFFNLLPGKSFDGWTSLREDWSRTESSRNKSNTFIHVMKSERRGEETSDVCFGRSFPRDCASRVAQHVLPVLKISCFYYPLPHARQMLLANGNHLPRASLIWAKSKKHEIAHIMFNPFNSMQDGGMLSW